MPKWTPSDCVLPGHRLRTFPAGSRRLRGADPVSGSCEKALLVWEKGRSDFECARGSLAARPGRKAAGKKIQVVGVGEGNGRKTVLDAWLCRRPAVRHWRVKLGRGRLQAVDGCRICSRIKNRAVGGCRDWWKTKSWFRAKKTCGLGCRRTWACAWNWGWKNSSFLRDWWCGGLEASSWGA